MVHDRSGPRASGQWFATPSEAALRARRSGAAVSDDLSALLESCLGEAVNVALAEVGLVVTMFHLGDIDLGLTGDVIQATSWSRWELARQAGRGGDVPLARSADRRRPGSARHRQWSRPRAPPPRG